MASGRGSVLPGKPDNQWNAQDLLIDVVVPKPLVFLELFTVIGQEYHDALIIEPEELDFLEELVDLSVGESNAGVVEIFQVLDVGWVGGIHPGPVQAVPLPPISSAR